MNRRKPDTKEEKALRQQGYQKIAGTDEAGKGSWAGPIVAGAVILSEDFAPKQVNDSKVLSPKQREKMFVHVTRTAIAWAVGVVDHTVIDRRGIQFANVTALEQALKNLHIQPDAILVDAVKLKHGRRPVKAIIDGDAKVLSIAAASIVAKVVRDALMTGQHRLYPEYHFDIHKGYGTAGHQVAIKKFGYSPIHRMSFRPMNGKPKKVGTRKLAKPTKKR